jgi:hypothetical protein
MTRIKMIGLAIVAVFAVMAVASASALAVENPVLVNSSGSAATNVSVTGKQTGTSVPTLQTTAPGAAQVECASSESSATLNTSLAGTGMTSGNGTVTFKKCKTAAGKCANKGTEEITGTVSILLVWVGKESNKTVGILISILPFTGSPGSQNGLLSFKCSGVLVDVQGSFIALTNKALNVLSTTALLIAKATNGSQQDLTYTENGVTGTNPLYSNSGGGAFAKAG